jgi:hypothetical protein
VPIDFSRMPTAVSDDVTMKTHITCSNKAQQFTSRTRLRWRRLGPELRIKKPSAASAILHLWGAAVFFSSRCLDSSRGLDGAVPINVPLPTHRERRQIRALPTGPETCRAPREDTSTSARVTNACLNAVQRDDDNFSANLASIASVLIFMTTTNARTRIFLLILADNSPSRLLTFNSPGQSAPLFS